MGLSMVWTGFIFSMTTLGAATVFFFEGEPDGRFLKGMLGFSAGIMTAASVWSLLLPAMEQAAAAGHCGWASASAGMLAGGAFPAVLDAVLFSGHIREDHTERRRTVLLFSAITLHNIPEGMAVGLACALAAKEGGTAAAAPAMLAIGIGVQNFPEGAAVSLPLWQSGQGRSRAFWMGVLSGAAEPVFGLLAAGTVSFAGALMPGLLSFAAGAMLYVTVEELLPQAHSQAGTWAFLAGFAGMMVLDNAF